MANPPPPTPPEIFPGEKIPVPPFPCALPDSTSAASPGGLHMDGLVCPVSFLRDHEIAGLPELRCTVMQYFPPRQMG